MIGLPPLLAGAVHSSWAPAFWALALTLVGAPGAVAVAVGVTEFECADSGPGPTALSAVTVKV